MQNKPKSKAIQIIGDPDDKLTAVFEDGSIWCYIRIDLGKYEWDCILEAPSQPKNDLDMEFNVEFKCSGKENYIGGKAAEEFLNASEPKNDLPAVGSRWKEKTGDLNEVEIIRNNDIGFKSSNGTRIGSLFLSSFLDFYEPIPTNNKEGE